MYRYNAFNSMIILFKMRTTFYLQTAVQNIFLKKRWIVEITDRQVSNGLKLKNNDDADTCKPSSRY